MDEFDALDFRQSHRVCGKRQKNMGCDAAGSVGWGGRYKGLRIFSNLFSIAKLISAAQADKDVRANE